MTVNAERFDVNLEKYVEASTREIKYPVDPTTKKMMAMLFPPAPSEELSKIEEAFRIKAEQRTISKNAPVNTTTTPDVIAKVAGNVIGGAVEGAAYGAAGGAVKGAFKSAIVPIGLRAVFYGVIACTTHLIPGSAPFMNAVERMVWKSEAKLVIKNVVGGAVEGAAEGAALGAAQGAVKSILTDVPAIDKKI